MKNDLATFIAGNSLPVLSDEALADAITKAQTASGDVVRDNTATQFLSFSGKTGVYALGKDRANMDPEKVYLIEPMSFSDGWICWKSSKPVDRMEWSFMTPDAAVYEADLPDHGPYNSGTGEGWSATRGLGCISLDDSATQIKFSTSAVSAKNAVNDLLNEIKDRSARKEAQIPVVHFEREQFEAQGNKNFKPKFAVEAWVTRSSATAYVDGDLSLEDLLSGVSSKK
jgi:hypothetical protein